MNLSTSVASLYKQCPRKFFFEKIEGWELKDKPSYLKKGMAYDDLLAIWDKEGLDEANKAIELLFLDPYDRIDARLVLSIYEGLYAHDRLPPVKYGGQDGNQVRFRRTFEGNDATGRVAGLEVTGILDKLSHDTNHGFIVVERKTTSDPIEEGSAYWDKLPLDPQIRCYVWWLRSLGEKAGRVVYEVIRKPSVKVSAVFDRSKVSSPTEYAIQVAEGFQSGKIKKSLVARRTIYIPEEHTDEWITESVLTFLSIQATNMIAKDFENRNIDPSYAWVKHEQSCTNYGGCPFREVCEGAKSIEQSGKFIKSNRRVHV